MRLFSTVLGGVVVMAATLSSTLILSGPVYADVLKEGKAIAFDRRKGNCLACHMIEDGALPGNQGPPLLAMKARFPDKEVLRAQIYDANVKNPQTVMPPFGKNRILTEEELDKVVEYIYSL